MPDASADFDGLALFFLIPRAFDNPLQMLLLHFDVVCDYFSWIVVMLCGDAVTHLSDFSDRRIILHLLVLQVTQGA